MEGRPGAPPPVAPSERRGAFPAGGPTVVRQTWVAVAAALLCLGGAVATTRWFERHTPPGAPAADLGYLPPPPVARLLTFGYQHLGADLMWIRTVQYFGKHLETDRRFPRLSELLQVTVGIDPHFIEAYRYGGLFLWIADGREAPVALLEDGFRHNPDRWEMPHDLGRLYFLSGDSAQTLRWWTIAQRFPDAPTYLPRFIARLHEKVGDVETALELWRAIESDPNTHEHFRRIAQQEIERLAAQLRRGQQP